MRYMSSSLRPRLFLGIGGMYLFGLSATLGFGFPFHFNFQLSFSPAVQVT